MIVAADKAMYDRKTSRKRLASVSSSQTNQDSFGQASETDSIHNEGFIVELDETHVMSSSAIN